MVFECDHTPVSIIVGGIDEHHNVYNYPYKGTQKHLSSDNYVALKTIKNPSFPAWFIFNTKSKHNIQINKTPKLYAVGFFLFLKTNATCYELKQTSEITSGCKDPKFIVMFPLYKSIASLKYSPNILIHLTQDIAFEVSPISCERSPAKSKCMCSQCNEQVNSYASHLSKRHCLVCASKSDVNFNFIVKHCASDIFVCHFDKYKKRRTTMKYGKFYFETGERPVTYNNFKFNDIKNNSHCIAFSRII